MIRLIINLYLTLNFLPYVFALHIFVLYLLTPFDPRAYQFPQESAHPTFAATIATPNMFIKYGLRKFDQHKTELIRRFDKYIGFLAGYNVFIRKPQDRGFFNIAKCVISWNDEGVSICIWR